MTIVLSDEDDDVPLDALVQKTDPQEEESSENKNNNANSNQEVIATVELSSEDDNASSSSSSRGYSSFLSRVFFHQRILESRAEDLLKEINAEDKRKSEEKRIIREEASCPLPPDGVKTPPPFPTTGVSTKYDRRGFSRCRFLYLFALYTRASLLWLAKMQ